MTASVNPYLVADAVVRAVARLSRTVGLFAESSSAMFYAIDAIGRLAPDPTPYCRVSSAYGSMGHALSGAIGFSATTGQRSLVLTGDGSLHLLNPLPAALKHGLPITLVILNDQRLGLPAFGTLSIGAQHAHATTPLPAWRFSGQGSPSIGGRQVTDAAELDGALRDALSFQGCFVVDVAIDPAVVPPIGARIESAAEMFGGRR